MRCLVTGASGHVGAAVTRRLCEGGAEVYALVRPQSDLWRLAGLERRVRVIRAELSEVGSAAAELREAAPEVVIHAAWGGVVRGARDDAEQMLRNVTGSLDLVQLARAAGCHTWVGIGSQAEYGPYDERLHESLPERPRTAYGIAKHGLGLLTRMLCESAGIRFVWLRLLAAYGPQDDPRRLIPSLIEQLLDGTAPALTPGEQRWDFLYIDDVAEAVARVAERTEASGVFNLASGQAHSIRDIAQRIRDLIDPALPLGVGMLPYPPGQPMLLEGDPGRLVQATGWSPVTGLDEGLRRTVQWHRDRRNSEMALYEGI